MPKKLGTFYVIVRRGRNGFTGQPVCSVMVKEGQLFIDQGGLTEAWGKNWQPVQAEDIEHARKLGAKLP